MTSGRTTSASAAARKLELIGDDDATVCAKTMMITVVSYHFALPIPCEIKSCVLPLPSLMRSPAMEV